MAGTITKPTPTLQVPQNEDYDPCALAKPCSPFYLYNHESPRPSMDLKPKVSVQVSERDTELGDLTPVPSQEKLDMQKKSQANKLKFWQKRVCLKTGPKQPGRIARLPKKQRILVKLAIALLVLGCMVGIAVGIAVGLDSTVWKNNNQVGNIAGA